MITNLLNATGVLTKSTVKNTTKVVKKVAESEVIGLTKELGKTVVDQVTMDLLSGSILMSVGTDKICEGIDVINTKTVIATEKVAQFNNGRQSKIDALFAVANDKLK